MIINSEDLTFSLPTDKIAHIRLLCRQALKKRAQVPIRTVAQLLGTMVASCQGSLWGPLHYRQLERNKITALRACCGDYDQSMTLSEEAVCDIAWWLSNEITTPVPLKQSEPDLVVFSDASLRGWGAICNGVRTGGSWTSAESAHHINWLELKASWLALQSLFQLTNVHVSLKLDNTCAMYYISNKGGVIRELDALAKAMWLWCKNRNLRITASHVPGVDNAGADFESRRVNTNIEWSLSDADFDNIVAEFGLADVDLFATRLNHKLSRYVSWRPDPFSSHTDAFSLHWGTFRLCYAFPPFGLVGRVVDKCMRDKADLVLVAPMWSTQYWYPMIMQLLVAYPLQLSMNCETLRLPQNPGAHHPLWPKLRLHCFRISGRQ